jgi:hypothetical protein
MSLLIRFLNWLKKLKKKNFKDYKIVLKKNMNFIKENHNKNIFLTINI